MMNNTSLRDIVFPEFSGGSYSPSGSGGLGEPGYQGRTADESKPPGWTPNPAAWGPYSRTPGGDPFYSALNTAARQTQEPWIETHTRDPNIFTRDTLTRKLFGLDIKSNRISPYLVASDGPFSTLENSDKASGTARQVYLGIVEEGGVLFDRWMVDGVTRDVPVELEEEVIVTAQRLPPSVPAGPPPSAPSAAATMPPAGGPQPSIASLTEKMLYRDLKESHYSPDALNWLNKHYEERFPLSGGNLRELLVKRAAAFATASGGQWRQGDYLYSIGNGIAGLLDYAGATIAGESWKQTAGNLATGIVIGGALGAVFRALGRPGAVFRALGRPGAVFRALGRPGAASEAAGDIGGTLSEAAGDIGGTLKPQLKNALPPESIEDLFANLIDNSEFSSHPPMIDRLSQAREFDLGGYKSLTARGKYGRVGDGLDSDEALQNAFVRYLKDISRHDPLLADNPAIALTPELHHQIGNLTSSQMPGRLAADVLRFHIDQMRGFTPDYVLVVLERESLQFIKLHGL